MFWDDIVYQIPLIVTCLGILLANILIKRLNNLRKGVWKPPSSSPAEEKNCHTSVKNIMIDEIDTKTQGTPVKEVQSALEESSEQTEDNGTEASIKEKKSKWVKLPLPDIPMGATIFEIMESNEFTSRWSLQENGFFSKVLHLYMCQGGELKDFRIAAGVGPKAGRMFGDIAFRYEEEDKKSYCFVRVVKIEGSPTRKIKAKDLKSSKDSTFSLLPLFESYVGIRQQFTDSGMDPSNIRFLTVFTNATFDTSKFEVLDSVQLPPKDGKRKSKISIIKLETQKHHSLPTNSYQVNIAPKKLKHYTGGDEALNALFLEFLEKLVFAVNQPHDSEIDEAIMDVLNHRLNLLECRFIFHEMLGMIANLPKGPTEKVVGEELNTFFQGIRQRLQRIYFSGAVLENHCSDLCSEDYFKMYDPLSGILQATEEGLAPLICISTKTTALTSLKVAYCLKQMYGNCKEPCFAVLDTLSLLKNKERVEDTFRCRREFVLAIKWSNMGPQMKAEVDVLVAKLIYVATNPRPNEKKTLVLIEDITKDFTDIKIYAEKSRVVEDQCEFMNFRDEIKTQFMKNKFVFQGQTVVLSNVITAWELKSLESRVLLLNQIIEDGQKCFASNYHI